MAEKEFNIQTEYNKLMYKLNLPSFDFLNNEFELSFIEKKEFLLRAVRRRMNDKVLFLSRILENILFHVTQNPIISYENSFVDEEKRKELEILHKKLMIFDRTSLYLDVSPNDNGDVQYIKDLAKDWSSFKKELEVLVELLKNSWKLENKDEGEKYFG